MMEVRTTEMEVSYVEVAEKEKMQKKIFKNQIEFECHLS